MNETRIVSVELKLVCLFYMFAKEIALRGKNIKNVGPLSLNPVT